MKKAFLVALSTAALTGCAGLVSAPVERPGDGLTYYMPRMDIKVTVTTSGGTTTVVASAGEAYPDLSRPYVLNFRRNLVGKNEMKIGVDSKGLLTSATAKTTPMVGEALKSMANAAGSMNAASARQSRPDCVDGTMEVVIELTKPEESAGISCGLKVEIKRLGSWPVVSPGVPPDEPPRSLEQASAGVFYRQLEPYAVSIAGDANRILVFSPSQSPVRFLPIGRSAFASSTASFTLVDGIPKQYDQDADGELVALLKLPADVISAYFGAIGAMFGYRKDAAEKEAGLLSARVQLELSKQKYEACIDALRSKDDALVTQLGCGQK